MEPIIVREEHLNELKRVSVALAKVASDADQELKNDLNQLASAECIQCAILVSFNELVAISDVGAEQPNSKVQRLRSGYCARQGCNSYFYRIKLFPYPQVHWNNILSQNPEEVGPASSQNVQTDDAVLRAKQFQRRQKLVRSFIALFLLGVALIARHWYMGGAIPVLREPRKLQFPHQREDLSYDRLRPK